jgi:uncharacterized protein YndB with AHSA1/START domain
VSNDASHQSGTVEKVSFNEFRIVTHIDIEAPVEDVWATLTDWDNLASWNSSFVSLEGDFSDGGHITVVFRVLGTTKNYEHDLIDFVDGSRFGWSDPFLMGMTDRHVYRLEAIDRGTTRFHQTDRAKGGAAGVIGRLVSRTMKNMYVGFNEELKTEVERRRPANE